MKKVIILSIIFGCLLGCNLNFDSQEDSCVDWNKYEKIEPDVAKKMAERYVGMTNANPDLALERVNMDAAFLKTLLCDVDGFTLINAGYLDKDSVTIIMNIWSKGENSYYDIRHFFKEDMPGMRKMPVLCPPPLDCVFPSK